MPQLAFPYSPQDLTPAWLTDALRSSKIIHNSSVTSIAIERVGAGTGWAGECVRVTLDYDNREDGAPAIMIAKFSTADPIGRAAMSDLYQQEVDFYTEYSNGIGIATPRAYFGAADQNSGYHALLLEDLSDMRHGDDMTGGSSDDALLAVLQLAQMHARWWDLHELSGPADFEDSSQRQRDFRERWGPCVENVGPLLSDSFMSIGELLCDRLSDVVNDLSKRPQTLIHGDYRYDNMFFNSSGDIAGLTAIDWQCFKRSCSAYDVSYFVAASLHADQRRELELRLLNEYHNKLLDLGVSGYDFDRFYRDYQLSFVYFAELWVLSGAYLDMTDPRGVAYLSASMERFDSILADHDIENLISQPIT